MNEYVINSNTSLLALNTENIVNSIIVYISTTNEIGQIVTIRDIDGFISTPQSIVISTVGCTITGGSPIILEQRFGYVTLQSISINEWTVINNSAFLDPRQNYSIRGLESYSISSQSNINIQNFISSQNIEANTFTTNTLYSSAPLFINSFENGPYTAHLGELYNTSNYIINGNLSTAGYVSLFSSLITYGISSASINIEGGIIQSTSSGKININGQVSTGSLFCLNQISSGFLQISTNAIINHNLSTPTTNLNSASTDILTTNNISLSTVSIVSSNIVVIDTAYTGPTNPVVFMSGSSARKMSTACIATDTLNTQNLEISNTISSSRLSLITLSSASIINPNGLLTISSINTGSVLINSVMGQSLNIPEVKTNTATSYETIINYETITPLLYVANANTRNVVSRFITTSSLNLGNTELKSDSIVLSTIYISSGANLSQLSSIQTPGNINNTGGSLTTQSFFCTRANVSTLEISQINSGNLPIFFSTLSFSTGTISSIECLTGTISSLRGVNIQFGSPNSISGEPYLIPSTVSGNSSNTPYEYTYGMGTVYSPITAKASNDKSIYMSLENIDSFSTCYINVSMNYRNDGNSNGSAGFRIRNSSTYSTLIYFDANPIEPLKTITLSNYLIVRDLSSIVTPYYITGPVTQPLLDGEPNILIGVGQGSQPIQYSSDYGLTWMSPPNSVFSKGTAVTWSGEKWVATGQGVNTIAYSYSGLVWYGAGSSVFTQGLAVVWNGSIWVAGGTGVNTLAYSYEGLVWTGLGQSVFTGQVNSIAWNGYMFLAGGSGRNTLAYSYDGIIWRILSNEVFTISGNGVAWGYNRWVAVGEGSATVAYSLDGINWNSSSNILLGGGLSVAWNGSQWLVGGTGTYPLAYSTTATTWTISNSPMATVNSIIWASKWIITGSSGGFSSSSDGINWISNSIQQFTIGYGIASKYSEIQDTNLLYTTGDNFSITYSLGGELWYIVQSLIMGIANCIIWNGTMWLAGMRSGSDTILYSNDGITWIGLGNILSNTICNQISWNGFIWVATCIGSNTLMYSYNGTSWTGLGTTIFAQGGGIAYGKGLFVANGGTVFASSLDGVSWTVSSSTPFTSGGKIAYGNSRWISCGAGSTTLAYSDDGLTWTAINSPFSIIANDIAYNGYQWLSVGADSIGVNVAYSYDGLTWTGITVANISEGITWTNAWFLTGNNSGKIVYKSIDGINWISVTDQIGPAYTIASKNLLPGTIKNSVVIGCGQGFYISTDGTRWISLVSPFTTAYCASSNGIIWVAGGTGTYQIAYSRNGVEWTGVRITDMNAVYSVAWSTTGSVGKWIAVGEGIYNRAESLDGITWTPIGIGAGGFYTREALGIIGGVGSWIVTGSGGLLYSGDGSVWSSLSNLFTTGYAVATNGKQFIATGIGSNTLAYSFDGIRWVGLGTSIFSKGAAVVYGYSTWVAVGEGNNTIAISSDGVSWTGLGTTIFNSASGIAWNGQRFIAAGQGLNTLATSPDGIIWTGLGTSVQIIAIGSMPNMGYSFREPRIYNLQSSGQAAAVSQTVIQKLGTNLAWDSAVYTLESYTNNAYLSFTPTSLTGWAMVGFSQTPSVDTTPSQLNYSISFNEGVIVIYQLGFVVQTFPNFSLGDTFRIIFTGTAVQYYRNTTLLRSVSRSVGPPLHMSCILYTPGLVIKDLDFHAVYQLTNTQPILSTTSFIASSSKSYSPPIYLTLNSDLTPSIWTLNITAGGTISSSSLYADVYINTQKYFSTNVLSNISLKNISTYTLTFSITNPITYNPGDTLNFQLMGERTGGDAYIYANWINSNSTFSSVVTTTQANPNAVEYLEYFHTNNTGLQTSEISVFLSPTSTNTVSYVNSNYGLVMNKSYIKWNNALNGITIENRYNDIQTRSLTYTGALYNASDSNLKHSIEYINTDLYMSAINDLPLRRFTFNDSYRSTFGTVDRSQLGVLTSEVESIFPKFVQEVDFGHCNLSTIKTIDKTQLRYAHLAATQGLIKRISTLKGLIFS